jgi:hypothetical protein
VLVLRVNSGFRGELRVIDERGQASMREVEGTSCEEVVRALSLTAALVVDQMVAPALGTSGSESAAHGDGSSPATEGTGSGTTSKGTQSSPPRGERERELSVEPASPAPTSAGASADELSDGVSAADAQGALEIDLGAQALIAEIVSPRVSVGGAFFVSVTKALAPPFSPSLGVALAHVPAEFAQGGGDVSVRWTALLLSACPLRFRLAEPIGFQPCAVGMGGWLVARGETTEAPRTASRSWWSAGVLGRVSAAIGGGTALRFELGLSVPLLRRRFVTTPPDEMVGESPALSALGALGIAHGF